MHKQFPCELYLWILRYLSSNQTPGTQSITLWQREIRYITLSFFSRSFLRVVVYQTR
jgi:hypothetical protein